VVPYLTLDAFRATLATIAQLPAGSRVSFDYVLLAGDAQPGGAGLRRAGKARGRRRRAIPALLHAGELERELRRAGFQRIEQVDSDQLNELYFKDRADGLKLSPVTHRHAGHRLGVSTVGGAV
jgi:O-methyltransferase involved in polyketide biosynthesis